METLEARRTNAGVLESAGGGAPPTFLGISWFGMVACCMCQEATYD
jgi:hypothetical protein